MTKYVCGYTGTKTGEPCQHEVPRRGVRCHQHPRAADGASLDDPGADAFDPSDYPQLAKAIAAADGDDEVADALDHFDPIVGGDA